MLDINNYILEKLKINKDSEVGKYSILKEGDNAIALGIDTSDDEIQITKVLIKELSDKYIGINRYSPLDHKMLSGTFIKVDKKNSKGYYNDDNLFGKKTVILPPDEGLNVIDFIINNSKEFNDLYDIYNFPIDKWMDYKIKDNIGFILKGIYDNMLKIKEEFENDKDK